MGAVKTLLISQARTGSTRLPGKVLLKIKGDELLKIHLDRLKKCNAIDGILVATTTAAEDTAIVNLCKQWDISVSRGEMNDVLDRFYQAAKPMQPEWVVRVTSDCPLLDPQLVDAVILFAQVNNLDYCSNVLIEHFPDGQDVEVVKFSALEKAWHEAKLKSDREHVMPYIRNNTDFKGGSLFKGLNFPCFANFSDIRMTVDELNDFKVIEILINNLGTEQTWLTYTNHIIENKLYQINSDIIRNEGMLKSLKND